MQREWGLSPSKLESLFDWWESVENPYVSGLNGSSTPGIGICPLGFRV